MIEIKLLLSLFWSFVQIGAFAIGGGYATIPLIRQFVIDSHHWITLSEFTNMIAISQMTPGPLAINLSTFVGLKIGGVLGSILATFGCVLTGVILSVAIFKFFRKFENFAPVTYILKGLRSATTGLIASACTMMIVLALFKNEQISLNTINVPAVIVFIIGMVLLRRFKMNMILLIFLTGVIGLFY